MTIERMKKLLKNSINLLESTVENTLMGTDIEESLGITQEEYDGIMDTGDMNTVMYVVTFDWATDDDSDIDVYTYADYNAALSKYKSIIADELNPNLSWIGGEAFDENGSLNDGYDLSEQKSIIGETDLYWRVLDNNSYRHSCVSLNVKEIN